MDTDAEFAADVTYAAYAAPVAATTVAGPTFRVCARLVHANAAARRPPAHPDRRSRARPRDGSTGRRVAWSHGRDGRDDLARRQLRPRADRAVSTVAAEARRRTAAGAQHRSPTVPARREPRPPAGVAPLAGNVPESATPLAQAYSGHQFGGFAGARRRQGTAARGIDRSRRSATRPAPQRFWPDPIRLPRRRLAAIGPMLREYDRRAMHARDPHHQGAGRGRHRRTGAPRPTLPGVVLTAPQPVTCAGTFQYAARPATASCSPG